MKLSPEAAEFGRIRAALGWTQNEMADRIRKTQSYVSQVERGESGVEETTMELLRWTAHRERPELFAQESAPRGAKNVISLTEDKGGGKEPADEGLKESVEKLEELRRTNPDGFAAAKGVIYALSKKPKKKPKPGATAG